MQINKAASPLLAQRARGPTPFKPHNSIISKRGQLISANIHTHISAAVSTRTSSSSSSDRKRVVSNAASATEAAATNQVPPQPRSPASAPSFQDAITKLQAYWASVGCALWLPHNTEVIQRRWTQMHCLHGSLLSCHRP